MSRAIAFITPGNIDLTAFTHFGVNAKPNTASPIGYFGTGLKYAVAVLLRNQIQFKMWIGETEYEFFTKVEDFRGKDFGFVRMRQRTGLRKWFYKKLPFTTELGKNWELWQAFRELESNTIDESGSTAEVTVDDFRLRDVGTSILVIGDKFAEEYDKRDSTFLREGLRNVVVDGELVQIIEKPSKYIYFRGLRVHELRIKALNTYNILSHMELTEDRTAKWPYQIDVCIAKYYATKAPEKLIQKMAMAIEESYEAKMSWDYIYDNPSEAFLQVLAKLKLRGRKINSNIYGYYRGYEPVETPPEDTRELHVRLIEALRDDNHEMIKTLCSDFRDEIIELIAKGAGVPVLDKELLETPPIYYSAPTYIEDNDIPF